MSTMSGVTECCGISGCATCRETDCCTRTTDENTSHWAMGYGWVYHPHALHRQIDLTVADPRKT